jgi:hypothetical protein
MDKLINRRRVLQLTLSKLLLCAALMSCQSQSEVLTSEKKIMHVMLQRTGGFTGIPMKKTVDVANMPVNEINELRQMVEAAKFFQMPPAILSAPQPDRFQYEITIEQDGNRHTVKMAETAVPSELKPLLNWILESGQ